MTNIHYLYITVDFNMQINVVYIMKNIIILYIMENVYNFFKLNRLVNMIRYNFKQSCRSKLVSNRYSWFSYYSQFSRMKLDRFEINEMMVSP